MVQVVGDQGYTEQPRRRRWSRELGWQTVREWRGPVESVTALVPSLMAYADEIEVEEGVPAKVTAYISDDDSGGAPQDREELELDGNDLERPLELHPWWKANVTNYDAWVAAVAVLKSDIEGQVRGVGVPQEGRKIEPKHNDYDDEFGTQNVNRLRDCLLVDTQNYSAAQYVLRHTVHAGSRSAYKASMAGVNRVVSSADLPSNADAKFNLPPDVEWLKKPPHVQRVGMRYRITQEYWAAKQWLWLYGGTADLSDVTAEG